MANLCGVLIFAIIFIAYYHAEADAAVSTTPTITLGNTIYLVWNKDKLVWDEAKKFCENKSMKLVSFETKEKLEKFNDFLLKMNFVDKPEIGNDFIYWTSGNDRKSEGNFVWESTGAKFEYTNWLSDQPDNWRKDEHCVEMGFRELGKWNDNRCYYHRHFICERDISETIEE